MLVIVELVLVVMRLRLFKCKLTLTPSASMPP